MDIILNNINKSYTITRFPFLKKHVIFALKNFSMHFRGGNIYALVGRNGAGKTTLFRIMAGIILQDGGTMQNDGSSILTGQIAYVSSSEKIFYEQLTAKQNIYFFSEISGLSPEVIKSRLSVYSEMFCLDGELLRKCWQLSSGTKRKLAIILGLMRESKVILIDEIFDKIDRNSRNMLMKHLRETVQKEGKIIVYTSHLSEYMPEFYDQIIEIDEGVLVNVS
jgi:ABC-type multidrug transport system ATPase subunit